MTEAERDVVEQEVSAACDAFMRKMGEKYPWLHPDYDPDNFVWRMRAKRAWNAQGRQPHLY